jgi:hypothetical protein
MIAIYFAACAPRNSAEGFLRLEPQIFVDLGGKMFYNVMDIIEIGRKS